VAGTRTYAMFSAPEAKVNQLMSSIRERVQYQKLASAAGERQTDAPMPRSMLVELSNGCNHACVFCTNPHMQRKVGRIDDGLLTRLMAEAVAAGVREIGFYTTGEPFVHKDLPAFTAKARELGFEYIFITTNGAAATPQRLKEVIDAGLSSIKFSINAGSRESYRRIHGKDDWDKVVANVRFVSEYRRAQDRPLALAVSHVVTDLTLPETESFQALMGPLVDDVILLKCHSQMGQANTAQEKLTQSAGLAPVLTGICHYPFERIHVTCEGYLTACCTDYHNYLALVDLNACSLSEAWNGEAMKDLRRRHIEGALSGTLCGRCWNNETGSIHPLVPEFATVVDDELFNQSVSDLLAQRIS